MRALANSFILLILFASAVSSARAAAPVVGELGRTERIEFVGQRQFALEILQRALDDDLDFLLAADPSAPLNEYLETINKRLLAGYQRAGFADAKIEAGADLERRRVVVSISEVRRYLAGPIRLVGHASIPPAAVARWLTSSHPAPAAEQRTGWELADGVRISDAFGEEPIWEPGKPAHFNAWAQNHLAKQVRLAFAEHGYFFPQLAVKIAPIAGNGTAELVIEVVDEGPSGVVGEIEILSTAKNPRDAILKLVELSPGMPLTHARLAQIKKRLYDSARFVRFDVRPLPPDDPNGALKLRFELVESEFSPLLSQPFSVEEKTLLKFRQWLLDEVIAGEEDLVFSLRNPTGRLRLLQGVVSAQGGALRFDVLDPQLSLGGRVLHSVQEWTGLSANSKTSDDSRCLLAMEAGPDLVGVYSPLRQRKYALPPHRKQVTAKLKLEPSLDSNRSVDANLGAAARDQADSESPQPFALNVELAPAAFVALAHNKHLSYTVEERVLRIKSGALLVEIDTASGRLLKATISAGLNAELGSLAARPGALDSEIAEIRNLGKGGANDFDAARPINSLAAFTSCELLFFQRGLAGIAAPSDTRGLAVWQELLTRYFLPPLDEWLPESDDEQDEFFLPNEPALAGGSPQNQTVLETAGFSLWLCRELFPADSWPCALSRAAVHHYHGDVKRRRRELSRIAASEQAGPVGLLIASYLARDPELALSQRLAARGLERLSAADFRRDYQLLLSSRAPWIKSALAGLGRLRELPPEEAEAAVNVLSGQLRYFVRDVIQAGRKNPEASIDVVLADVLDKYWDARLQWFAKLMLRALADSPAAETVRAAKKGSSR